MLHAADNEIDDEGAKAVAAALEKNTTVTEIDLGGTCMLGGRGLRARGHGWLADCVPRVGLRLACRRRLFCFC